MPKTHKTNTTPQVLTVVGSSPTFLLVFEIHWHGGRLHTTLLQIITSHRDTGTHIRPAIIYGGHPSQLASPDPVAVLLIPVSSTELGVVCGGEDQNDDNVSGMSRSVL